MEKWDECNYIRICVFRNLCFSQVVVILIQMLENEPFSCAEAKKRILSIVLEGQVSYSKHALVEIANDSIHLNEVLCVLRGGVVEPAEFEHGSWRYRIRAQQILVVIAFRSEVELRVITAWRLR